MKKTNRILSAVLAVIMLVSLFNSFAFALTDTVIAANDDVILSVSDTGYVEIDYEAALAKAYIVCPEYDGEDLADGDEVEIQLGTEFIPIEWDNSRCFYNYEDMMEAYLANVDLTTGEKAVFYFGPGDYEEIVTIPYGGIVLGPNAGINPNADTEWDYTALESGWDANDTYDDAFAAVFTGGICRATRDTSWVSTTATEANKTDPAVQANNRLAFILEDAETKMAGAQVNLDIIIDGISIEGGKDVSKDFDIGQYVTDGDRLLVTHGRRSNNYYLQNSIVRDNNSYCIEAWDTAKNFTYVYFNKNRMTGLSRSAGLFNRGIDGLVMADCYFANATNSALMGEGNGANENSAFGVNSQARRDQTITFKRNFFYNNNAKYLINLGNLGSWNANQADPGISRQDLLVDDNIFIDASKGAAWGFFCFWNKNVPIYTTITNNTFYEKSHTMSTMFNANEAYQANEWHYTFTGNKVIGNVTALIGNINWPLDNPANYNYPAMFYPEVSANYWAANDGDMGKPVNAAGNFPATGYANEYNAATAGYYYDSEMTTLSTDLDIVGVTGVPGEVTVEDGVFAKVSAPNATGTVTPVIATRGEGTTVTIYADADKTEAITGVNLDEITGLKTFPVVIEKNGYTREGGITFNIADSKDFVAALEADELGEFTVDNTVVYIPGIRSGETVSAYWGGTYYDFVCDNYYVYGSLASIAGIVDEFGDDLKVVLPAVEYSDFEIPFAATFVGANYGIDPNVKPETTDVAADWSLNSAWGEYGETGIGLITIANGVEGKVVLDGITMRSNLTDRYRGVNRVDGVLQAQNLDLEMVNIVVDHTSAPAITDVRTINGTTVGGPTSYYLWNLSNDRSNSSDEEFLAVYNDTFTAKNVYVKSCKMGTFRWLNERVPVETTFDSVYCDFAVNTSYKNIFGWVKNTSKRPRMVLNYIGCNFRGDPAVAGEITSNYVIELQGQQTIDNNNEYVYEANFIDNIFYDMNYAVNGAVIRTWPRDNSAVTIKGNTFYSTVRGGMAFASTNNKTEDSRFSADDVVVEDNNFIGVVDSFKLVDNGTVSGTNNFYTNSTELNAFNGKNSTVNSDDFFWLDAQRTLKSSDLAIVSVDAGTSGVENVNLNNDAAIMNFALIEGTTEGMTIELTEGATGAWYDATMAPVDVIDSADIEGEVTYYYVLSLGEVQRTYTVTVMGYIASDFKGNYVQPDGIISDNALLVSGNAMNLATGTLVPYKWDGQIYFFYAGINAFGTLDAALAYAKTEGIAPAEILLTEWSTGANITLGQSMKVFAPNYDTMPYIADAYGAASDGGDWEENPAYFENELTVGSIYVGAGSNGGVAELYGVTFTGTVNNSSASVDSKDRHILLKNVVKNGKASGKSAYLFTSSGYNYDNTSSLYVQNLYIKKAGDDNESNSFRLIGELVYHETTFDGLWMDGVAAGHTFVNASYVKPYGDGDVFTFKNCNIRNWYRLTGSPVFSFEPYNKYKDEANTEGEECSLVFENNILYNVVNSKSAANNVFFLYWYPGAGIDQFVFNDNFLWFDNIKEKVTGFEVASNNAAFFYSSSATNSATGVTTFPDDDTFVGTVTGNKFINAGGNFDVSSGTHRGAETFTIHDNFTINSVDGIEAAKAGVGTDYTCGGYMTRNAPVNFWLDYDMTKSSDVIYDYEFANDGEKFITDAAAKTIQYLYNAEDGYVTETEVVTEPTDEELAENPDAQAVTTYKYTVKLGAVVASNPMRNAMSIAYGDASANLTGTLTINSDEQIDISSMIFNVTVSSPDGTAEPETYTLSLVDSLAAPAGIESITVGDVEATLEGDVYSVTLPADGDDEAIVIVPTEGTEITADASVGSDVSCGEAVEFTITAVNGEDTKTFTLSVIREHTYNEGEITTPATCVATGVKTFTCSICNDVYEEEIAIDPEAHDYDDGVITTPATCCAEGVMTYTCKNDATHTYEKVIDIDPNAHAWNEGEVTTAATCSTTGVMTYTCANDPTHTREEIIAIDPNAHVWDEGSIIVAPDCETDGLRAATCTLCGEHADEIVIPATGHAWGEVTYEWADDNSKVTATRVCGNNEDHVQTETAEVSVETVPATCTEAGSTTYTAEFENEAFETQTKTETIDALNHAWGEPTYEWADDNSKVTATRVCANDETHVETETVDVTVATTAATCTEAGKTVYTAEFENEAFETQTKTVAIDALNHEWSEVKYVWADDNSNVTASRVCARDAAHVETETVNTVYTVKTAATTAAEGVGVYTATFKNAAFAEQTKEVKIDKLVPTKTFVDVKEGAFYKEAVDWAVAMGVTAGTDDTHFSPNADCTRGQVVTFLWRAAGSPEPTKTSHPFTDVKESAFYYKAMLWAVENGITNGTSATTFAPGATCTRGQVVAFLWRAKGQPKATVTTHKFTDVKTGAFYYDAMLWAVEKGITKGMSDTTFAPGRTCTRGQVVTFLYRAYK